MNYEKWKDNYEKENPNIPNETNQEELAVYAYELWCHYLYLQHLIEKEDWDTLKEMAKELRDMNGK